MPSTSRSRASGGRITSANEPDFFNSSFLPAATRAAALDRSCVMSRRQELRFLLEPTTLPRSGWGYCRQPYFSKGHVHVNSSGGKQAPMGRMGETQEVVDAVMYLEQAAFVTGEILHVDGGASAGRW